jgi:hypothetical protein
VRPGVAEQVGTLVSAAPSTSFAAAVTVLVNELAAAPDNVALVVDDYHVIDAPEVHRSLDFLLRAEAAGNVSDRRSGGRRDSLARFRRRIGDHPGRTRAVVGYLACTGANVSSTRSA